jgi:hypothetical protein
MLINNLFSHVIWEGFEESRVNPSICDVNGTAMDHDSGTLWSARWAWFPRSLLVGRGIGCSSIIVYCILRVLRVLLILRAGFGSGIEHFRIGF